MHKSAFPTATSRTVTYRHSLHMFDTHSTDPQSSITIATHAKSVISSVFFQKCNIIEWACGSAVERDVLVPPSSEPLSIFLCTNDRSCASSGAANTQNLILSSSSPSPLANMEDIFDREVLQNLGRTDRGRSNKRDQAKDSKLNQGDLEGHVANKDLENRNRQTLATLLHLRQRLPLHVNHRPFLTMKKPQPALNPRFSQNV